MRMTELVISPEHKNNLEIQINGLEAWCKRRIMRMHVNKAKIMQVRVKSSGKASFEFKFNNDKL